MSPKYKEDHRTPKSETEASPLYREAIELMAVTLGADFPVVERMLHARAGVGGRSRRVHVFPDGNTWPSPYCPRDKFPRGWIQHRDEDLERCADFAFRHGLHEPLIEVLNKRLDRIDELGREFATEEEAREPQNLKGYVCYVDRNNRK